MSTEQEEAKQALDGLAREIHGIYGQHATEAGLKAPKWEDLPESARGISRDISRLVLAKMQEAYAEGIKVAPSTAKEASLDQKIQSILTVPIPKLWTVDEALKFVDGMNPRMERLADSLTRSRRISPISRGLDDAISRIIEKIAFEVITEAPDAMSTLRSIVENEISQIVDDKEDGKKEDA